MYKESGELAWQKLGQSWPLFIPAVLGIAKKKRVQYNLHAHAHNQPIKSTIIFLEPAICVGQMFVLLL